MSILFIHPIIQACGIIMVLVTFISGLQRFRSLHLKQRVSFPRKRHVFFGKTALVTLTFGMAVGLGMVRYHWGNNLMTMGHGKMGLALLPLLLLGLASGVALERKGQSPLAFKVAHGLINTLLMLLALNQVRTGYRVIKQFVLGL